MAMIIDILKEAVAGETCIALVSDVAKCFRSQGAELLIEKCAKESSAYPEADLKKT
jgi:NAD/NADP transhydrogenase alpha subunit